MSALVDSGVTADYLDGRAYALALIRQHQADGLAISLIAFGEV